MGTTMREITTPKTTLTIMIVVGSDEITFDGTNW
jgi:hypothetical protein